MQRRFWDDVDLIEWKAARILAFLSDDNRRDALERDYLPVDVQHLRFQKRRAITGDDRVGIRGWNVQCFDAQPSTLNVQRNKRENRQAGKPVRRDSQDGYLPKSKEDFEELNTLPFSRDVRVERRAVHPGAVSGGCPRIEHLERVTAVVKRSRNHPLHRSAF